MTDQEHQLIVGLIERTGQGAIKWERQSDPRELVAVLDSGLRARMRPHVVENHRGEYKLAGYALDVRTEEGATGVDVWEEGQPALLARLYEAAEASVDADDRRLLVTLAERTERGELRWEREGDLGRLVAATRDGRLCIYPWFEEAYGGRTWSGARAGGLRRGR